MGGFKFIPIVMMMAGFALWALLDYAEFGISDVYKLAGKSSDESNPSKQKQGKIVSGATPLEKDKEGVEKLSVRTQPAKVQTQTHGFTNASKSSPSSNKVLPHLGDKYKNYTMSPPEIDAAKLERSIHELVNEQRKKHGFEPLSWDDAISGIARDHSKDMISREYFAHNSPDGTGPAERGKTHGYDYCGLPEATNLAERLDKSRDDTVGTKRYNDMVKRFNEYVHSGRLFGGIAENIAKHHMAHNKLYVNGKVEGYQWKTLGELAKEIVQGWMDSPGHRENILAPFATEGIGVAVSEQNWVYATQNFC